MMNILAVYHATMLGSNMVKEGFTSVRKGRHLLCAGDYGSDGELISAAVGWIRNKNSLMRDLGLQPCVSNCDIIIAAYRRWGMFYPEHIKGPVSTVLIDRSADRMVVSRDRMGDTRMFYCRKGRTVAVSDHPDALIDTPYASGTVDAQGINELFAIGPARTPGRTPYRDIMALEPGCFLCAERSGVSVRRYYSMEQYLHEDDTDTTIKNVRELLERSMDAYAPMATSVMLSGGLDSTVMAALMHSRGINTLSFSVDYEGDKEDFTGNTFQPERDREYAALAAELYSPDHRDVLLNYDEIGDALDDAVDARGFPGMADIDSSLLLLGRRIAGESNVVISGECADEVFCGYPWFSGDKEKGDGFPWSGSMALRNSVLKKDVSAMLKLERYAREAFITAMDAVPAVPGESSHDTYMRKLQSVCFRYFMSNLQERALCMCGASGIRVLTPFSDERLAEYVWNVPADIKFLNGETKGLLRASVADILPEKLLRRKKSPYPKVYSPKYTQKVKKMIKDMLSDRDSPVLSVIDAKALGQILDSDLPAGGMPWFGQLMSGPQMLAYIWQVNEWMAKRNIKIVI